MPILAATPEAIEKAAVILKNGGLVAMPTETVYGLAANAYDGRAVAGIFAAKGRPAINPLISHGNSVAMLQDCAEFDARALALADAFWPGPLSMILPRKKNSPIAELVCAGLDTIALRVPAHDVALQLINACGFPLAAPSANISGSISPTTPLHVQASLGDKVDAILAAGACLVGLESTVVDLSGDDVCVVRAGAVLAEDIERVLGIPVIYELEATDKPRSPGQLLRHYAPRKKLRLRAVDVANGEALLAFGSTRFMGVQGGGFAAELPEGRFLNLSDGGDLLEAAANLFAYMRKLDEGDATGIAVMDIPEAGIGLAINDRLRRAAGSQR